MARNISQDLPSCIHLPSRLYQHMHRSSLHSLMLLISFFCILLASFLLIYPLSHSAKADTRGLLLNFHAVWHNCGCDRRGSCAFLFWYVLSVRIRYVLRTLLSKSGEKRGKICLIIIFRCFLKLLLHLPELLNPHLHKGCYIAP